MVFTELYYVSSVYVCLSVTTAKHSVTHKYHINSIGTLVFTRAVLAMCCNSHHHVPVVSVCLCHTPVLYQNG